LRRNARSARSRALFLAFSLAVCWAGPGTAKEEPLWEVGLGGAVVALNDYPGASSSHVYPLPFGYFLYNGKFLKSDRNGVRGLLVDRPWVEFNVSAYLTAPVRNNAARSGMPELRSTLELGPAADFHLFRSDGDRIKLDLTLPLRSAFTVAAPPRSIGWVFEPNLSIDFQDLPHLPRWNLGLLAGPMFADARYHDYFYSVAPQYALASRPEYAAPGGYSGARIVGAISKHFPTFFFGAYLRYDTLAGASFVDSPLVERKHDWSGGFGVAWMVGRSHETVDVPD
jgi:outer membrane scaffolding protein for murein synthesis (MipA/OmpV family)